MADVETFDKYETKRDGLTCDEALEASILGYRVRCKSLQAEAYVHYVGEGWRIQFVHDGREGSSCAWSPTQYHWLEPWQIVPLPSEVKRDGWGRPIVNEEHARELARDSWGRLK
jgi:hypothetical protein